MAAVGVICADTDADAQRLLQSVRLLQLRIRQNDRRPVASPEEAAAELRQYGPPAPETGEFPRYFAGTPEKVRADLLHMAAALNIHELFVNTITHDHTARLRSYSLLAEALIDTAQLNVTYCAITGNSALRSVALRSVALRSVALRRPALSPLQGRSS